MDTGIVVYCIVIAILFVALAAFAAVRQQRVYNRIKDCYSSKDRTLRIDSRGKDLRPVISIRKVMDCHLGYEPEKLHYGSATVGGVTSGGFYTTGGYNKILDSKNSGKAMLEFIGESSALNIALDMLSGKSQLGKAIDQIILSERLYAEAEKSNIAKYLNPETMSIEMVPKVTRPTQDANTLLNNAMKLVSGAPLRSGMAINAPSYYPTYEKCKEVYDWLCGK